jgi:hypothetical protein
VAIHPGGRETDNVEAEVAALNAKGVIFEECDFPNLKKINSIATSGNNRAAWLQDSEGNPLASRSDGLAGQRSGRHGVPVAVGVPAGEGVVAGA